MKKFLCITLCFLIFAFNGCAFKAKTEISPDDFVSAITQRGFNAKNINESTISASNGAYTITFFLIDHEQSEVLPYALNQILNTSESSYNIRTNSFKMSGDNYDYIHFNSGDTFFVCSRIGCTIMTCEANKEYRTEILDIFDELGYK